jgi:glycine C-acetyltransferase
MVDKLEFIRSELAQRRESNAYINIPVMESPADGWMIVNGKKVLNFCTNNYLGLANHPMLKQNAKEAIDLWGLGPAAVRTIAGTQALHLDFERRMAEFKGVEASMLVQSGFCANQAAIPALVGRDRDENVQDVIFSDELNHASIIDGARLSGAKIVVYRHCDPGDLENKIKEHLPKFRRGLVITDGVFSMDGDIAPLDKLYEVAEKNGLLTMVDDAHGEGVLGLGKGIVAHFGLHGKFDIEIGTLSKAFGVMGGVIAGRAEVIDYIRQKARPNLFSSGLTPADTAACLAAVEMLDQSTEIVRKLWDNTAYIKDGFQKMGFNTGRTQTPIIPIMVGEEAKAKAFSAALFEAGVFAMALGFPTVPQGTARIRVMNTAAHSRSDLDAGLEIFATVGRRLGIIRV